MRLMSFALTERQLLDGTKTVTRRLGWKSLKPGTRLRAVHKAMGLKPGEHPRELAVIRVVDVRRERLEWISQAEVEREGFDYTSPGEFIRMFCEHMGCKPTDEVTRIEFVKEPYVAELRAASERAP